jgi:hypothetical protein
MVSTCRKSVARIPAAWQPGTAARSVTPAWCGLQACGGQDPADRVFADAVAEADELALDAPVAPARILPGQLLDERADFIWDSRRPAVFE